MKTLKDIWHHIDDFVERNDYIVPIVSAIFIGLMFVVLIAIPDPKPITDEDELEAVKTYIVKIDYEGHSYLLYKRSGYVSLCHNENCKCKEQ